MTMPNSPITDAIADAFARFDATPRAFPEDMEELTKRVHFNPHLHPRDSNGRFTFSSSGKGVSVAFPGPTPDFAQIAADIPRGEHRSVPTANPRETSVRVGRRNDGSAYVSASGPSVHVVNDIHEAPKRDWGYQDGDRIKVVGRPPSGARGNGDVLSWTGRDDTFRVQLDDGSTHDLPMEHLQSADPRNDTRAIVQNQRAEYARLGQELKDEEGNAIGNPEDWSAGHRVVLRDGSYVGRDDQYPNALFIDEPGANMQYDVSPEDIFDFARTKQ